MKFFVLLNFVLWSIGSAQAVTFRGDDVLPWPWGSECPFPWSKIEGEWVAKTDTLSERFTFTVQDDRSPTTRVLLVHRFRSDGELIATGRGLAPRDDRVVRAVMVGVGSESGTSYWAIVRTYSEKQKKSCSRNKQVTVITLRSADGSAENETHMVLEKAEAQRKSGP